jgi:hypothetical protein
MQEKPRKDYVKILLGAIIVIHVITNIRLNSRVSVLENGINTILNNQTIEMRHLQWAISSQLASLETQIHQMSRLSFDEAFTVRSYNNGTLHADVEIVFNLKEYGADDIISVTAAGQDGRTFTAAADPSDTGRFTAFMSLPVQDNFTLTFTAMGTTVTSGDLMEVNLADSLCERFKFALGFGSGPDSISLTPHFTNAAFGNDMLAIRSISISALSDGNTVKEWDLLPYLRTADAFQFLDGFEITEAADPAGNGITAVRLVIYDNLGIRYEQMEHVPFITRSRNEVSYAAVGSAAYSRYPGRVILYGEDSWHFIHMVSGER